MTMASSLPSRYAELLRTLGQELDREGEQPDRIQYVGGGFRVWAVRDGTAVEHYYGSDELMKLSATRRLGRQPPAPRPGRRWPFW
jgi:hypothetical protein